jgi:hypothetical protein
MLTPRPPASGSLWPLRFDASSLPADAALVDGLARLALVARRHHCEVWLTGPSPELLELIEFMGLAEVLRRTA